MVFHEAGKKTKKAGMPQIRFAGFVDEWEQCKLGEIYQRIRNAFVGTVTPYYVDDGHFYLESNNVKDGQINRYSEIFINDEFYEKQKDNWLHTGDLVMVQSGHVGHTAVIPENLDNTAAHALIIISNATKKTCPFFLNYQFQAPRTKTDIDNITTGNTIKHILASEIKKFRIQVPIYNEQKKLGKYFENLENLITLCQHKYNKLVDVKKSMCEKMFPKDGEAVPEIRFKGFSDAWEQRKLGEMAEIVGGGTPSTGNPEYWDGDIDWYAPIEIADQIYLESSQRKITELGYDSSSAKILPPGTVLFTSRAGIGKTAILANKGCTNQGFQSIVPYENKLDSYFIFSRTDELKRYGETIGAGSTFAEVSGKQMANMKLMMPKTIAEQQTIGVYFKNLDRLITLHQRKLEKLKNLKKAFLEKMFI